MRTRIPRRPDERQGRPRREARRRHRHVQPQDRRLPERHEVAVVKAQGEFVWHSHPDTDDFFLVLDGELTIQLEDRDVQLRAGELYVVPRGVRHCPRAGQEAHVLLIEPRGTPNTGDAGGELTAREEEI